MTKRRKSKSRQMADSLAEVLAAMSIEGDPCVSMEDLALQMLRSFDLGFTTPRVVREKADPERLREMVVTQMLTQRFKPKPMGSALTRGG